MVTHKPYLLDRSLCYQLLSFGLHSASHPHSLLDVVLKICFWSFCYGTNDGSWG